MKQYFLSSMVMILILYGCGEGLPTIEIDENFDTVVIDDIEYALHQLSYNG